MKKFLAHFSTLLFSTVIGASHAAEETAVSYRTIPVGGLEIFYRDTGPKDAPVLLLLHGFPSSSRMYQPLFESALTAKYRLIAPDYPGFGHSSWPDPKTFAYTFDHLASVMQNFVRELKLDRYTLFLQDYGGPIGMRMAVAQPEKVEAIIIQNAVSHEEGLSPLWEVRRKFWKDRATYEDGMRKGFLSLEATRQRHVGTSPTPQKINPDTWQDEFYFLNQPGQVDIQTELFFDYQHNVESYPRWQKWLRDHQPRMLVLWGQYDPSFTVAGAQAYGRDVPKAEIHILEAGHFALDEKPVEILQYTADFLGKLPQRVTTVPSN